MRRALVCIYLRFREEWSTVVGLESIVGDEKCCHTIMPKETGNVTRGSGVLQASRGKEFPETLTGGWGCMVNFINDVKGRGLPS